MSMEWISHIFLHPNESVLFFFPMQMDGFRLEAQWVEEEKPLFGMLPQRIPVKENVPVASRMSGVIAVTTQRMLFLTKQAEQLRYPEVVLEIYLHDLVEVESKGVISKELHLAYEHNEVVHHQIFYGPNAAKIEQRLLSLMQTQKWLREHPKRIPGKFIRCRSCEKLVDWRDKYCPHCGHHLTIAARTVSRGR
ncbi:MAG: hypothetical protein IPJ89_04205 [Candidatus Iainarchaeum archaeon]|uniref:Zinc ribbon domain-containing protein n=1 Tax=Candidatus Iainarchaeum sp. TaxID=3101447 RepID=A0A7T9I1E9_9ARCH|nr:MAG: hypothetical protein IPJ89_04205 [Candidatus Diapherotrites archaeon]